MFDQMAGPVIEGMSSRLATASSNGNGNSNNPPPGASPPPDDDWNRTTPSQALRAATGLAGCFRAVDASDAERFIGAIAAVLQSFAPDIVQYVCDPRTGLPGKLKWMPSVAEVKEACNERCAEKARVKRYDNWGKPDDDERERRKDQGLLPPPRAERPSLEQLKAKYGENWGISNLTIRDEVVSRPKPQTKDQAFIDKVHADAIERQKRRDERTRAEYHNPGSTMPQRRLEAEIILGVDGNPVDQGADF